MWVRQQQLRGRMGVPLPCVVRVVTVCVGWSGHRTFGVVTLWGGNPTGVVVTGGGRSLGVVITRGGMS
jgi:hypothetical protein